MKTKKIILTSLLIFLLIIPLINVNADKTKKLTPEQASLYNDAVEIEGKWYIILELDGKLVKNISKDETFRFTDRQLKSLGKSTFNKVIIGPYDEEYLETAKLKIKEILAATQ
jgi:hypothetical protein